MNKVTTAQHHIFGPKFQARQLLVARIVSMITTPFYLPTVSMMALFIFSYLSMLPMMYKLQVLLCIYLFTIVIPTLLIHFYRTYHGWSFFQLRAREKRMVPYIISFLSYLLCFYIMNIYHMPHFMTAVIVAGLMVQAVCLFTNIWFKVSTHTAGIGGFGGGLVAYSLIFGFDPVWWLSIIFIIAGVVGSARMILRVHSLHEVVYGFLIGFFSAMFIIFWI